MTTRPPSPSAGYLTKDAKGKTFNNESFWTEFLTILEQGSLKSDPSYYVDGLAQEGEWANVISTLFQRTEPGSLQRQDAVDLLEQAGFWEDTDDLNYWVNIDANDPAVAQDINSLKAAGEKRLPTMFGGPGGTPGVDPTGGAGDDPDTVLRILSSPSLRYYRDPSTGKYYAAYDLPNSERTIFFDVQEDQLTALFGERLPAAESRTFRSLGGDENFTYSGNIAEMEGDGVFEEEVERVTVLGLEEGRLPAWADDDPAVRDLIYIAQSEQKSNTWLVDQIAQLDSFKARFPSIEAIKKEGNLTYADAVTGFLEYEAGLRKAVKGIGVDPNTVTPDVVGSLMDRGYSIETASTAVTRIDRMNKHLPALNAFNAVLVSQGQPPITDPQEMFNFMAGQAPQEMYDIWEASSVSEAAVNAGLGDIYSAEDAMQYALFTEGSVSFEGATQAFQSAAQLLLRMRNEVEFERYGLTQDELLDLSLGVPPSNGRSAVEVQEAIQSAVQAGQASRANRARPYTQFARDGRPQAQSLGALRQPT